MDAEASVASMGKEASMPPMDKDASGSSRATDEIWWVNKRDTTKWALRGSALRRLQNCHLLMRFEKWPPWMATE